MWFPLILFNIVQQARYLHSELRQEREELDIALAQVTKFDERALFGDFAKLTILKNIAPS